jgi:hypothetical protein
VGEVRLLASGNARVVAIRQHRRDFNLYHRSRALSIEARSCLVRLSKEGSHLYGCACASMAGVRAALIPTVGSGAVGLIQFGEQFRRGNVHPALSLIPHVLSEATMTGVGAVENCGLWAVFQAPVDAFCASTGAAASTPSLRLGTYQSLHSLSSIVTCRTLWMEHFDALKHWCSPELYSRGTRPGFAGGPRARGRSGGASVNRSKKSYSSSCATSRSAPLGVIRARAPPRAVVAAHMVDEGSIDGRQPGGAVLAQERVD